MHIGRYVDGRTLDYDESGQSFSVGGTPVSIDQVIAYDRADQLSWLSAELRSWVYEYLAASKPTVAATNHNMLDRPAGPQPVRRADAGNHLATVGGLLTAAGLVLGALGLGISWYASEWLSNSSYGSLTPFVSAFDSDYASQMNSFSSAQSAGGVVGVLGLVILIAGGATLLIAVASRASQR